MNNNNPGEMEEPVLCDCNEWVELQKMCWELKCPSCCKEEHEDCTYSD